MEIPEISCGMLAALAGAVLLFGIGLGLVMALAIWIL